MSKIPGKLKAEDFDQLKNLVDGRSVLMLGCYCGRGLVAVAQHAKRVWVLDDFIYPGGFDGLIEELKSNANRLIPADKQVDLLYGTADEWAVPSGAAGLQCAEVEVVYRDADRSFSREARDQQLAMGLLTGNKGGKYVWHDENSNLRWLVIEPVAVEVN